MLTLSHVSKSYGKFPAVEDISLRWSMGFTECLPQTVRERQLS